MTKIFVSFMSLMFITYLVGCSTDEYENLEWTNNEAIYVNINDEYREDVLSNLAMNFKEYNYKKIYVVGKEVYEDGRVEYQLLFILNCDLESFINKLKSDNKIESFSVCKDLPYESFDNRKMKYDKEEIEVGESLTISLEGECDIYYQPFEYDSFYVKTIDYNKDKAYSENDFPELKDIDYIEKKDDRLLIGIKNSNYYKLIKSIDALSNSKKIKGVYLNYIYIMHPIWEISNTEIVDFIIYDDNTITITALKPGSVIVKFGEIECNITIIVGGDIK